MSDLTLTFTAARIQDFGGNMKSPNFLRLIPDSPVKVAEEKLMKLFAPASEGGDPFIEMYRQNGELIIKDERGDLWKPTEKAAPAKLGNEVIKSGIEPNKVNRGPTQTVVERPDEAADRAEVIEPVKAPGGGVPGQGVVEGRKEITKCDDLETLKSWRENETRSTLTALLDKKIEKLSA